MPKHRVVRHEVVQPQDQSIRIISLTQGQNAIVDVADYDWLNQYNWFAQWAKCTKSFYAKRRDPVSRRVVAMEAQILDCSALEKSDHRNHDTLDNRRYNLRKATASQNAWNRRKPSTNTSGFKGVYWGQGWNKWCAGIRVNGHNIFLGGFSDKKEAATAYDDAAKRYFGEFAHA